MAKYPYEQSCALLTTSFDNQVSQSVNLVTLASVNKICGGLESWESTGKEEMMSLFASSKGSYSAETLICTHGWPRRQKDIKPKFQDKSTDAVFVSSYGNIQLHLFARLPQCSFGMHRILAIITMLHMPKFPILNVTDCTPSA